MRRPDLSAPWGHLACTGGPVTSIKVGPAPGARQEGGEQVVRKANDKSRHDPRPALRHLRRADPRLARVIAAVGPCQLEFMPMRSPFHSLLRAITYQQLSGKAAATILGRVVALVPEELGPPPAALVEIPDKALRGAGLSRNKLLALKDLAAKTLDGTVPDSKGLRRMPDMEVIERLTEVRGVGRWTVEMLLIF